jgi:hypothetical protein
MKRFLAVLPIALLGLSACGGAPASSLSPGSPGAPVRTSGAGPATHSGLGDNGGGAGSNGTATNPAQQ